MGLNFTESRAKSLYSKMEYKDKDRERDIKKDVKEEFNRIDSWRYRDDQEIWEAGMNTIDRYILQLKYSKGLRVNNEKFGVKDGKATLMTSENIYKNEALSYFKKARNDLVRKYNAVSGIKITSSAENRQLINDIAYDIDKAENDALKKIKLKCNPMQEQKNAMEKSSVVRDRNGNVKIANNGTDVVRQKPMFTQDKKGTLTFTDRSNKPKIHEALKGLFPRGKNYKYKINYKGCTNPNIKSKMMQFTGTGQCWISYDESAKTYLLRDKNGKPIEARALIWEGVTLQRDELIQWNTYEEEEKRKENIGKVEASAKSVITPEKDSKLKDMVGDIPDSLKKKLEELGNEDYRRFIIETEKRLGAILRYGKQHGYELHTNPVSKLQVSSGLMEIHFINGDTEPDVKVWENSNDSKIENAGKYILGEKLYNMLDGNESDYLTYLTARVKKLWGGKFDELTVKDDLLEVKPNYNLQNSERLPEQTVGTVNYGIGILRQFIENHRESEGDSRADNDDRYLVSMKKELDNLEYTIQSRRETTKKEDMKAVINKSIDKLASFWGAYRSINPAPEKEKIRKALLGSTNEEQNEAVRKMAEGKRIFGDVTESSFLADKISTNGEAVKTDKVIIDPETGKPMLDEEGNPILETSMQGGLEVENAAINEKFQNINKLLYTDLVYNSNNKLASSEKQIKIIKDLYTAAGDTTGEQIIGVLIQNNMLPEEWRYDKDVKEKAKNIAESLRQKEKAANSLSINDIKANEQKEKRQLEMKSNKTEEDLQRLQALQYLEEHPTEANKIHQTSLEKMKDEIRYGEINDLVRNSLASIFVDKGGGAKGKNADIYNDIVGYGFWDVSDETAKVMGEILTEIVITVVVAVCTMGTGTLIVAGALRGASMLARSARWVKLANNISKAVKLLNTGAKGWKVANAAGKTTQILGKGTALLIEGTTFNAASNVIHSAMNGTSLDSLNLNPVAKENIQTAAFLGALSVSGRLTQGLMKLGGKTKLTINLSKGLEKAHLTAPAKFTTGLVSEMGSMLAAEQAVNFTFGHDVIDPETGEVVTSHAPTLPTGQEWIQMVGMILAFKAVKPGLWQKYEKKLNDGTLEICRSVKKKEVLIRDPKTGKVENVQNLIDGQYNNYKPTPEQYQLRNHNKWREKQSKYELEILEAQEKIGELPENLRSEAMKKLLEAGDIVNLSPNDIKRIQREIGLKGKEVNGIFDSKSLAKLKEYVDGKKTGPKLSVEKPGDTQNTNNQELLRRREELQKKKESHEKRKSELEKRKSELERRRDELLRQREQNRRSLDGQENAVGKITDILKQGNIITIDGLKYKFTGVKNGKAEFIIDKAAKKSAEKSGKTFSEKVEVSSLEEFLDSRFNLEPGKKGTNSGRYQKLNELINDKVEPLDRLQNKIKNKQGEISTLEEEIARLERGRNTTAHNDYFEQHKNEIVGKNVRIDGVKYSAEHVNADGSIQFKEVDGKGNFTVSSFKQLAEKGDYINGFSDYLDANGKPKIQGRKMSKSELDNHELIRNLISGEKGYLDSRNLSETIKQKRSDLQTAQQELKGLQDKLPASQARQQAIDARAKKGAEINKELGKLETELEGVNRDLSEAERLINKYQGELDRLPGETAPQEGGGKEPEIRENTVEEPVVREEPAPEVEGAPRGETTEEILADEFDAKALNEGITINGDTYKLEYRENTTQNKNRKGEFVWIKNGKVIRSVKAETRSLPDNADGNRVRSEYNRLREEYVRSKKSGNSIVDRSISSENVDLTLENNPELIESRLNQELGNGGNFENVKLDWITKAQFETGVFIEGVHRRFKNISLKPNIKLPKEFLKKMGDKLVDMKNTWGEKLGEYHRKLIDKYNSYIERKLAEKGEKVEIKKEEIDIIEKSSKTFGEYNQEFADIIRNNQNKIINLEKIENMDSFINESFKFLKEEMGIDDPNLKIKILEGTEGIDNHYDRSTNTVYFSRNFGGERQIYLKGGNKAETFGGIGHELNHYLQEVEIIKHYLKDNETINTFVEGIMNESDKEWINRYINQIDFNEPISERAIKYAKYYTEAGKDKTIFDKNWKILDHNKYRNLGYEKESFDRGDILADEYRKTTKSYKEQQRRQQEEQQRRQQEEQQRREREEQQRREREEQQRREREEQQRIQREEQERRQREEQERRQREEQERRQREEGEEGQDADVKVLYAEIQQAELNMLRNLNKGRNEQVYLETFGEPKNVISLGNGENLYVSNCLSVGERKFVVGFSKKGGELKLRLFYRSKSEGARRSCPGKRALKISPDGEIIGGGGFSKGENIPNSSYETTTRVINELQYKFDSLPQEKTRYNPIDFNRVGPNILEPEMASTIKIDKLFNGPKNDTVNYIAGRTSAEVKDMYRRLGENVDMSEMKMVEGKGYTYEHQYLGTIEVQICRLNYNGKNLDFSFAKVKNDPENRVRIEGVNYADAKITSFGIYDKQINAAPLTGKPIDYATYNSRQVPKDRQGKRYGENYMDIRDLYQENPFVKKFKEISKGEKNKAQEKPQERREREEQERRQREEQERRQREEQERRQREEQERRQREEQERRQREEQERRQRESNEGKDDIYSKTMSQQEKIEFNNAKRTDKAEFYINEGFEPKNVIHLPSGEKLYVTDKIVKGGSRPQIVGYALENGKMNIRLFYRSNSEGCRRSSGGARQVDGAYSKGEFIKNSSYETTTKVDYKLGELFDKLNPSENFSKRWNAIEGNLWEESGGTREEILKKEMQKNIKVESVMFPDLPKGGAVYFYEKKPPQEVINGYNKLVPKGLNYTEMRTIPEKGYSYNHNYLGAVNVEATQMKYKGKDIYIYFARAKNSPDKVWIENIVYADAKINSFGVYDKQINAGPLIAKPIDYESQVPIGWTGNGEYYGGFMGFRADGYIDIRDLYQGNPIIKEYKKLSGEKSYENDGREYSEGKQRRGEQRDRAETRNVGTQQYSIGQEVYVKRSAGGESRARVESYNPRTKEYTVRWEEGGERLQKIVKSESLREVQAQEYQLGQEVYVKRSAGGESRARIESYNPRTKKYKVVWKEGGERLQKTVTSESLRMAA